MRWETFYGETNKGVDELIGNLAVHRDFINTITSIATVKNARQTRLLEVGAGSGDMSLFFSWLGYRVKAIDNNKEVLANIRSRDLMQSAGDLELLHEDAFNMSFSVQSFDIAFSQGFFEHFNDTDVNNLIIEQLRVARTVVFSVPSIYYPGRDLGDERLLKIGQWEKILGSFKIINAFYYSLSGRYRSLSPSKIKYFLQRKPTQICLVVES